MDRRRNNPRRLVRLANVGPERPNQHRPQAGTPPCDNCGYLQQSLANADRTIADWNQWHESVKPTLASAKKEKASFNRKLIDTKKTTNKLEADLETKEREFAQELKKCKDILFERDSEIASLKIHLQKETLETNNNAHFWEKQCISMTAQWEAEKVAASELKQETLQVKLQIQKEWQKKVKQLEEQLSQRDAELLTLTKQQEDLSERLMKTSNRLSSKETDLLQTKCEYLEKFKKEMAEREQSWEARVRLMEEEKKKLQELCLKEEEEDLSERLMDTANQLISKDTELLQSQKTWQTKCDALEEKLTKDLAEREQSWEARVRLMEEEKKKFQELCLKEKEDLYERLTETSNQLISKETELLQSQKTWQTKCDALEEKVIKELAEREQSWEARVKLMEEEMNILQELCLKKKKKKWWRRFLSHKKKANTETGLHEAGQTEEEKTKKEKKEKKIEKKRKEKEEMTKTEAGFSSWLNKKKKCDGDGKVEEAAGCSA